jgi:hypothetical protein
MIFLVSTSLVAEIIGISPHMYPKDFFLMWTVEQVEDRVQCIYTVV